MGGMPNVRQEAFSQLEKNTDHWSEYVDVAIDNTKMVRITITYLDPVLVQYIALNHAFSPNANGAIDAKTLYTDTMNKLAERNEMLFLVTITTPLYDKQAYNNGVLTVKIPIKQMALISGADLKVYPVHEDHVLDETINITHGPVVGIVGYPHSVLIDGNCTWVIDKYTNTLTLDIPTVTLGNTSFGPQYWSIPYQPLIAEYDVSSSVYDPNYDMNRISPLAEPPKPNWTPGVEDMTDWKVYWEDMGRYIWNLVITENYH